MRSTRKAPNASFFLLPLTFFLFLLPLSLAGCAKRHKAADDTAGDKKKEKKDDLPKAVGFGEIETTVYQSSDPKAPISFTVGGSAGNMRLADGNVETGNLEKPHGHLFQNGKATSTYRADNGDAVREIKRLNMRGHVQLQSIDKTQTLTSKDGEYRGDVKLIRAMGDVVATGPFGTLSGVPELWATPDLKLIGSPTMVAKTLKIPALVALAATAAAGKPVMQGKDIDVKLGPLSQIENLSATGLRITLVPVNGEPIVVRIPSRKLMVQSAGRVVILTDPKGREVRHMTSQSAAHVVQTSDTGTTTMDGDGSTYDAPAGSETGTLDVGGRVTLTSVTRRKDAQGAISNQTTVSKGDRGRALLLAKPPKDGDALKEAVLIGNVVIDSKGSANGGTFNGVGDRLVYTPRGTVADVDLTGDAVVLTNVKTTQRTVSRSRSAHAVIDQAAGQGTDPLRNAILTGGVVSIDVKSGDGGTFKATGDKVVYTASVDAATGAVDVSGGAVLTSVTSRKDAKGNVTVQTTVSKGDQGRALLLTKPTQGGDALKQATLTGNVVIDSKGSANDGTFNGVGDRLVYTPHGEVADVDLTGDAVVLTNAKTTKDEKGNPTTQKTVTRGRSAHAVVNPQAGSDIDPLKNATVTGGTVSIDVTGTGGGTFKGTGDKLVYTATGGGNGRAVMTGDLKFSGDAPDYLSDISNADTAVLTIGRTGWKTIHLENSGGGSTTTTIQTKTPPTVKKSEPGKGGKKKKGGKG